MVIKCGEFFVVNVEGMFGMVFKLVDLEYLCIFFICYFISYLFVIFKLCYWNCIIFKFFNKIVVDFGIKYIVDFWSILFYVILI